MHIDSFVSQGPQYLSDTTWDEYQVLTEAPGLELMTDCQGYCTDSDDDNNPFISQALVLLSYRAKTCPLPLQSTFGYAKFVSLELSPLGAKGLEL
jgi:hypothetical protein